MRQGRYTAALFLYAIIGSTLLLSGCGNSGRVLRQSLSDVAPAVFVADGADASQAASDMPYASLAASFNGRAGLIVLAEQAGAQTYFMDTSRSVISLRNGYLASTAGFPADLLFTQWRDTADVGVAQGSMQLPPWRTLKAGAQTTYRLQRQWRTSDGDIRTGVARATLACRAQTKDISLPLTTLPLQRCDETAVWANGESTRTVLWRQPEHHRLWQVDTVAWPGGPHVTWQVARPWW